MDLIVFRDDLFALWRAACETWEGQKDAPADFAAWSGATKDVLMGLGMHWDDASGGYKFTFRYQK